PIEDLRPGWNLSDLQGHLLLNQRQRAANSSTRDAPAYREEFRCEVVQFLPNLSWVLLFEFFEQTHVLVRSRDTPDLAPRLLPPCQANRSGKPDHSSAHRVRPPDDKTRTSDKRPRCHLPR